VVRDANGQALVYVYSRDNDAEALCAYLMLKRNLVGENGVYWRFCRDLPQFKRAQTLISLWPP
jgi:hypothetical protein